MAKAPRVLGIVLAGGEGKRLMPLTADRAKPAVPFGGSYRLIDFVLSNLANAGIPQPVRADPVQVAFAGPARHDDLADVDAARQLRHRVPAQQRLGPQWYQGSADAIYQSMNLINDEKPDIIVVFGADHVYRMDASQMVQAHIERGNGVTVAGIRVPRARRSEFGVIKTGRGRAHDRGVPGEAGRPARAAGLPGRDVRLDGQLRVQRRRAGRGAAQGRGQPGVAARHGRRHRPDAGCRGQGRASTTSRTTTCPARWTGTARTGATSVRSTRTTRRTWTWSRSSRCSTSTTPTGRSSPRTRSCPGRSSPTTRPSASRSCAPARSSPARPSSTRCWART